MGETVSVIGAGVIGGAIVKRLRLSQTVDRVIATRRRIERLSHLKGLSAEITSNNVEAARKADIVFVCVKPGDVAGILEEKGDEISGKLVISTATIIPLEFCRRRAPRARFIRTMPNVAAFVGESYTAYCCDDKVTERDREALKRLLDTMGQHDEVEEKYMDALTGLSGSGPAYVVIVIESLMYIGLRWGCLESCPSTLRPRRS